MNKDILVYIETMDNAPVKLSLETLSCAYDLSRELGSNSIALVIGEVEDLNSLTNAGADKVINVKRDAFNAEEYAYVISEIAKKYEVGTVLVGASNDGKDIAAYVASNLKTSAVTSVQSIEIVDGELEYTSPEHGGTVLAVQKLDPSKVQVASIRSGSFPKKTDLVNEGEVIEEEVSEKPDLKTIIKEVVEVASESVNLEDAEIIVTCGRGASTGEAYELVKQLADTLNAPISGTRPVIDDGILPKASQIGQSGKIVAPKLYIGCGVSGAVQHISGIQGSDFIVAINKDEAAPIFNIADVGIVGAAEKILPIFIEEIKKVKA